MVARTAKTFEEMRDSGEDNRTKSIVVDEVEVTLVGWDIYDLRETKISAELVEKIGGSTGKCRSG